MEKEVLQAPKANFVAGNLMKSKTTFKDLLTSFNKAKEKENFDGYRV